MSTSAHERRCYLSNNAARDIANSLFQKWAIKGFFPAGERSEPRSRTAPEGSLPTERGQTVPALRPELDDPNKFGSSNHSAPADRSPRRIAGRAARVAVPRAFFGTFFRFERKYCPLRGGSPSVRAGVGASIPAKEFPYSIVIVYSGLQMTFRVANNRQISKRRPPASFPKIYRFELLLLNWAIIRNFFSLALI